MKDRRYANRGKAFEDLIRHVNASYESKGTAMIYKMPTEFIPLRDRSGKVYSVKVEHKSIVDFIGRYKQYPIAIEAKHTNSDSIRLAEVQLHQAYFMDLWTAQPGTIGFVLVSFNLYEIYAVPWAFWGSAYDLRIREGNTKASARVSAFGEEWDIPKKKSLRIEDMSVRWRVTGNHRGFGFDYLKNAEKYVILG